MSLRTHKARQSIRLRNYDYTRPGFYFVTLCSHERAPLFGQVERGVVHLSEMGRVVGDCWREIPSHFPNVDLDAFVIMPDHVHGIVVIRDGGYLGAVGTDDGYMGIDVDGRADVGGGDVDIDVDGRADVVGGDVDIDVGRGAACCAPALQCGHVRVERPLPAPAPQCGHVRVERPSPATSPSTRPANGPTTMIGRVAPGSLGAIVRSFKSAVTRAINIRRGTPGARIWQRNYHERIIWNDVALRRIRWYIVTNPGRAAHAT
ncbi:MAG: transposase [Gemmatimonadales bacterium]